MSGILSALSIPTLGLITDWRSRLLPASFRGVPFQVESHEESGGRRAAVHEFPFREIPQTEDLGGVARRYTIEAYLIGDDYDLDRDALREAVFETKGFGTLVHPYLGSLQVQAVEGCSFHESRLTGRMCTARLVFVQSGAWQNRSGVDTAAGVLNIATEAVAALKIAYGFGVIVANHPGFLLSALTQGLGSLATSMLGLPGGIYGAVTNAFLAIPATPTDPVATPLAIANAFAAASAAVVAYVPPAGAGVAGTPLTADISQGLAAFAGWAGAVPPVTQLTPATVQQAANAQTLNLVVQGCAVTAVAQVYAQTDFSSAQAAAAALQQLLALIDSQALVAPDDATYFAWQDLAAAVAADLIARGQMLPQLGSYSTGVSLPAVVLEQRLYADQADAVDAYALADLNVCDHPLFMPAAGVWLEPVS